MKQSHNRQTVPLSTVDISSLLIFYAFKQFEIIVTFNPTKSNYEHPIFLLKKVIEKCIRFSASTYLVTVSQAINCWRQCKGVKSCALLMWKQNNHFQRRKTSAVLCHSLLHPISLLFLQNFHWASFIYILDISSSFVFMKKTKLWNTSNVLWIQKHLFLYRY